MRLDVLEGEYAIARLAPDAAVPDWARPDGIVSITRTADELSIVCRAIPENVSANRGWRCLKVRGPLDFSLTGVLASIAAPLADAAVPIFAISTFETDYVLIPQAHLDQALRALAGAGHKLAP